MQKAYLWPVYGPQDEVVFTFSTSKSRKHPRPLLEDWQGTLLTDGNPVYDSYCKSRPEVTLAQCWTHSGRYFVRAREAEPADVATALDIIGRIYHVEAGIREKERKFSKSAGLRLSGCLQSILAHHEHFLFCNQSPERPLKPKSS